MPHQIDGAEEFRLETESAAATNAKACSATAHQSKLRVPGSRFGVGSTTRISGRTSSASVRSVTTPQTSSSSMARSRRSPRRPVDANGYEQQMWDPFHAWLEAQHPDDVAIMDRRRTPTEESIRLWEQRSREWVEARLAAEQVATEFLEAFAAFDAKRPARISPPAPPPSTLINQDVRTTGRRSRCTRHGVTSRSSAPARQLDATATGLHGALPVRVPLAGIPRAGCGSVRQNYFTVTVDDASGMITEVNSSWRRRRLHARGRGPVHRMGDDDASGRGGR